LEIVPATSRAHTAANEIGNAPEPLSAPLEWPRLTTAQIALAVVMVAVFLWSYWPTLAEMVATWEREPDYSHGFLVAPIAIAFLWLRRNEFPRGSLRGSQWGWAFLGLAFAVRIAVSLFYIEAVDGWTIPLWLAGVVLLLGGWSVLKWCAASLAFLWFMFPLPFAVERYLSQPLQGIATRMSTSALQMLGQPAIAEGNVILMGEQVLEVEQACSGLRIFVGIFALAFAYVLFARKTWWENVLLLISAVPIALVANSTRIVTTALLQRYVSGEVSKQFTHDFSGWIMIPFAALLFWLFLVYVSRLFREVEVIDAGQITRRELSSSMGI
jgi:exosortase